MMTRGGRALIVGCHGGVGRAVLALLARSTPGRRLREHLDAVLLLDAEGADPDAPFDGAIMLPPHRVRSADEVARLVSEHRLTQVLDLSSMDTVDCTKVCDELGADFLSTSVEEWSYRGPIPTDQAIARLLPPMRPALTRRSHLVGSGANPGIVNALVFAAIEEFATRVGTSATVEALDLHAVLITEEDTTAEIDGRTDTDVFAMTWSPRHCLEELFESRAFAASNGKVIDLGHRPTARYYTARCGDRIIDGLAVPHEEIVTLAQRLRTVEIGFIYRLPAQARLALEREPLRLNHELWEVRRLYPPWTTALAGKDRVGVLLCSRRYGELWMGFDTDVASGMQYGTNATQLQVAAGVLAGWAQLGRVKGIHFVEDLDWRQFLATVTEVLGETVVVHDPKAAPVRLVDRARHVTASVDVAAQA